MCLCLTWLLNGRNVGLSYSGEPDGTVFSEHVKLHDILSIRPEHLRRAERMDWFDVEGRH